MLYILRFYQECLIIDCTYIWFLWFWFWFCYFVLVWYFVVVVVISLKGRLM